MFLDASVILAILLKEAEGDAALEAIVLSPRKVFACGRL